MRVLVSSQITPSGLKFVDIDAPMTGENSVRIGVTHFALNPGEVRGLKERPEGTRVGWDIAGIVRQSRDLSGRFRQGQRVLACVRSGGWAEEVVVDASFVSKIPDDLEAQQAVCLPVPGLTAFCALRFGEFLVGRRVLITAAAGAVGQFACQLALAAGAQVTAVVRNEDHTRMLNAHGVTKVCVTERLDGLVNSGQRFDLIIDSVAGPVFEQAVSLLTQFGRYVVFAAAGGNEVTSRAWDIAGTNGVVRGFDLFSEIDRGSEPAALILERLLDLLDTGQITCPLGDVSDWEDIENVLLSYLSGSSHEKPVLRVSRDAVEKNQIFN